MLVAVAIAGLVGLALQPLNIRLMRRMAVIDYPNSRSSHDTPTPRGGGLVVVLAAMAGLAVMIAPAPLLVAVGLFAVLGLAEDLHGLPVSARLGAQLGVGAFVAVGIADDSGQVALASWLLVVLITGWLIAVVNVSNFMDGINGISALQAIGGGLGYAVLGSALDAMHLVNAGLIVAAAGASFLPWNALRARIFLGDVGSYGLGAALGVLSVYALIAGAPPEAAIAPLALYLADTTWTLARRILAREPWLSAHRSHVYQRLTITGWSHLQVASLCGALTVAITALGTVSFIGSDGFRALADLVALSLIGGYLSAPRLLERSGAKVDV